MVDREDEKKQLTMDYKQTFDSPEGKRVVDNLRKISKFDLSVLPIGKDDHIDIHAIMRYEGQRSVVLHILKKIEEDLDKPKQIEAIS